MSKKYTPLWYETYFQVKIYKTPHVRAIFGGSDVGKGYAIVARSIFPNQIVQNTKGFAPLLEVQMLKKCMPLWREAGFEIKIYKTLGVRTTFGGSDIYITLQDITLYYTPVHYITLHDTPGHSTALNYTTPHYITLND